MPRYFTLDQARHYLPRVEESIRQVLHLKKEHERASSELDQIAQRVMMMGGMVVDRERLLGFRGKCDATAHRLKELLEEIGSIGCQVKDLDVGLLDFPTLYHGQEVLLCWRLGESDIEYWHGLEEGFRGRKPIDQDFLDHHQGEAVD